MRRGTDFSQKNVFLHNDCEQIYFILFFCLSHQEEMRDGTHFTQQNMFLPWCVFNNLDSCRHKVTFCMQCLQCMQCMQHCICCMR
jgi:hypothetical protein